MKIRFNALSCADNLFIFSRTTPLVILVFAFILQVSCYSSSKKIESVVLVKVNANGLLESVKQVLHYSGTHVLLSPDGGKSHGEFEPTGYFLENKGESHRVRLGSAESYILYSLDYTDYWFAYGPNVQQLNIFFQSDCVATFSIGSLPFVVSIKDSAIAFQEMGNEQYCWTQLLPGGRVQAGEFFDPKILEMGTVSPGYAFIDWDLFLLDVPKNILLLNGKRMTFAPVKKVSDYCFFYVRIYGDEVLPLEKGLAYFRCNKNNDFVEDVFFFSVKGGSIDINAGLAFLPENQSVSFGQKQIASFGGIERTQAFSYFESRSIQLDDFVRIE